ncbi:Methionine--tRNA ligase [Bienertia sinuspersici]
MFGDKGKGKGKMKPKGKGKVTGSSTSHSISKGKGRGRGNLLIGNENVGPSTQPTVTQTPIPILTQQSANSSNPSNTATTTNFKKRVPRTTAIRKGLVISEDDGGENRRVNKKSLVETDERVQLNDDDDFDVGDLNRMDEPLMSEQDVTPVIHDDFDPYEGPIWEDDCEENFDNYIQRLYNNGEFYNHDSTAPIVLKPWQMFTDKQSLKSVIRDYCIQSGFSITVERATNFYYTVRCSDVNCGWRLHSSKLVDGITWAIKSIHPSEHTCLGIETDNPMVNAQWACNALLEDIRANNDIPGKALNELLWDRHKSIDKACAELWPEVDRRFCTKHLSVNFKKVYGGPKMWQLFWLAVGAYSDFTFGKAMKEIDKVKPSARVWLANLGDQSRWTKHKFNPDFKCDINKTNFVESFNATLGTDRCRPVLTLLENLRRVTMVRLAERRELCEQWERFKGV